MGSLGTAGHPSEVFSSLNSSLDTQDFHRPHLTQVHSEGQGQELSVLGGILQQSNTNTQGEIHTRHMWGLAWLKNLLLVEVNLSFNNSRVTTSRSSTRDMPNPRETLTFSSLNEEVGSEERSRDVKLTFWAAGSRAFQAGERPNASAQALPLLCRSQARCWNSASMRHFMDGRSETLKGQVTGTSQASGRRWVLILREKGSHCRVMSRGMAWSNSVLEGSPCLLCREQTVGKGQVQNG